MTRPAESQKESMRCGARCRATGGGSWRATAAYAACRGGSTAGSGGPGGRAHVDHVVHGCDARGVEAQWLVERRRVLPRVEKPGHPMREMVRAGKRYRALGGGGVSKQRAHTGRSAPRTSGVEDQRLVERRRLLPSRKESTHTVRGELRAGRREAAGKGGARSVHRGGLDCGLGAGHGEGRTRNMRSMFVTLEVSKLSGWLNADAP
eukprot:scaffold16341_cov57-Phaeocystis_antarctica.AAC.2